MTPRLLLERLIGAPFDDHPDWLNGAPFDNPMPTLEWTLWQVTRATLKAIRTGANPDDPTLPLARWHALWDIEDCRIWFEARGDCFPVLGAIRRCVKHQLVYRSGPPQRLHRPTTTSPSSRRPGAFVNPRAAA